MSVRLNKTIRRKLTQELVKQALVDKRASRDKLNRQIALQAYNNLYSEKTRDEMATYPEGWLPEATSLSLDFASFPTRGHYTLPWKVRFQAIHMSNWHTWGAIWPKTVYPATHSITKLAAAFKHLEVEIIDEERRLTILTLNTLASFYTVQKLISAWPEVEPFANQYLMKKPVLPAPLVSEPNKALKLGKEKKQADVVSLGS